ncbi:MAG: LPS-assembly protein LptD [Pseudorhodoplanes sp.]
MAVTTATRFARSCWRLRRSGALFVASILLVSAGSLVPADAQQLTFPPRPKPEVRTAKPRENAPMLLQASEIRYDYPNERVLAVGNVQIYYSNSTVEADRVIYNQKTKRLRAEGNVRLTEPDGKITYGEILDLSDDYRDGFVDSLRLDAAVATRFAAARAERSGGNFTVFQSGVYTACEPCKDDPKKPPLWQIKAARIIHDQGEKMIYFENAQLEFFGKPVAYFPYFSAPDPTVKRKSGFLIPMISSNSKYGVAVEVPYYWALAPDYDVTVTPMITTRQGPLMQGEFRQRLMTGSYSVRAAGIFQLDRDVFVRDDGSKTPGYRDWRGSIESSGQFALNQNWVWGWDALILSDKTFFQDYNLSSYRDNFDPFKSGVTEGVSQIYLTGVGNRSFFDARAIHYFGFSEADRQGEIPVIHPVVDYNFTFDRPILGGELGYNINFTSLTRSSASYDAVTASATTNGWCQPNTADPRVKNASNCLLRGIPGTYSRLSADLHWRRSIIDPFGQVFTPFASLRADAAAVDVSNDAVVSNYINTGDTELVRGMPTIGMEYRYPFINVQSWGSQTIEPIAQVIIRPNESQIGKLPNEDAQSLVFDDSNLFKVDKFSGWDRAEGGSRANAGIQYTAQFNGGGFVNVLFGQSYQLFGKNSFAVGDLTNTGLDSGLETTRSDYVARISYQPDRIYTFTSRFRFDEQTFDVRRFEMEASANFDRWSATVLYGNYDAQPLLGFLTRREGILGTASLKLNQNWVLLGSARYDIDAEKFDQTRIGLGYIDDCLILALNYVTSYSYSGNPTADHRVMLQLSLRTLGGTSFSQGVNGGIGGL